MSAYHDELLDAAERLLERQAGQRGRLARAKVGRSISTIYYALFHFLCAEVADRLIGTADGLRVRRRIFSRVLTHGGMKKAFDKIRGTSVDPSVREFFETGGVPLVTAPTFARNVARTFLDVHAKREAADYDLNEPLSETDARLLHSRVGRVICEWQAARGPADRDFKHALSIVIALKGQLRRQDV